ncbi:MAG: DUF2484 family protein [Paracoccaceae bacterium]
MTLLLVACFWAIAATIVALLPMRHQYIPGVTLLIAAPVLIVWIGYEVGYWAGILSAIGFVSMFRNPLRYFWAKARGKDVELPDHRSKQT